MINVSEAFKTAMNQPARYLDARLLINGIVKTYDLGEIEYNSAIGEEEKLVFGSANRSSVKFTILDEGYALTSESFEGKEVNIQVGIKLPDESYEYCSLGLFTVTKPERDKDKIKLEGKDRMYLFEKPYVTELSFPATLLQIAQDIASKAGVTLKNTSFRNSGHVVQNKPVLGNETLRTAIGQVAELAGGFARITRDGKLEIFNIEIAPSSSVFYSGDAMFVSISESSIYDELVAGTIDLTQDNMVTVKNDDLAMAVINKVIVKVGSVIAEEGEGSNLYQVIDNLWCQNPSAVVSELYEAINGLSYLPYRANWQGSPAIEAGDLVSIDTGLGYYMSIVGSKTLAFNGGLKEDYEANALGETGTKAETVGNTIIQLNKVKTEVKILDGEFQVKIESDNGKFTAIDQDIDSIELSINATTHSFTELGYELKDDNGASLMTPNGMANEQNFGSTQNVESGYPLNMSFKIGDTTSIITSVQLRLKQYNFRTDSKGAANGGGSTSGPSSKSTSDQIWENSTGTGITVSETNGIVGDTHMHVIGFSQFAHAHGMAHTHATPAHGHTVDFGILETPNTDGTIDIFVDGVYRLSVTNTETEVDITPWVTTNGVHSISLVSPNLKRIQCDVFIKSYIRR